MACVYYIVALVSTLQVKVIVKWELQDGNKQDIFCVEVAAEITDSENAGNQLNEPQFSNKMPARINPSPIGRNYRRMKTKMQALNGLKFSNKMPKDFNPISDALKFSNKMPKDFNPIHEAVKFSNKMPKAINPISQGLKYIRQMPKEKQLMKKLKHIW